MSGWLAISSRTALIHAHFKLFRSSFKTDRAETRSYTGAVRQAERLGAILERLSAGGSVSVSDIASDLGVSGATVRRDPQPLEGQPLLPRTHRGAAAHR